MAEGQFPTQRKICTPVLTNAPSRATIISHARSTRIEIWILPPVILATGALKPQFLHSDFTPTAAERDSGNLV